MPKGTIKKLMRDRGFGFITTQDGKELFFHRSALPEGQFDALKEGESVDFQEEQGPKGPRATKITAAS